MENIPGSGADLLDYAEKANRALYPELSGWVANGTINKDVYPNIIQTDACFEDTTKAVELSIEICKKMNM